jgi:RNA polymerase sigma-70 factor (ECF subfamily)
MITQEQRQERDFVPYIGEKTMQAILRKPCNVQESDLLALLPHLRAFARGLTRNYDSAEDLVQDTVVRALTAAHRFEPGTNLKAWTFTILRNLFYNGLRKNGVTQSLDDPMAHEPSVPASQEAWLEFGDFRRAFWQIGHDKREALVMVGINGLSYDDTGKACGCAQGTVKSRVSRARRDLRQILDGDLLAGKRRDTPAISAWTGDLLRDARPKMRSHLAVAA